MYTSTARLNKQEEQFQRLQNEYVLVGERCNVIQAWQDSRVLSQLSCQQMNITSTYWMSDLALLQIHAPVAVIIFILVWRGYVANKTQSYLAFYLFPPVLALILIPR